MTWEILHRLPRSLSKGLFSLRGLSDTGRLGPAWLVLSAELTSRSGPALVQQATDQEVDEIMTLDIMVLSGWPSVLLELLRPEPLSFATKKYMDEFWA